MMLLLKPSVRTAMISSIKSTISPVIKWSGSKRTQAYKIASLIPKFETYYEPFIGGGSVMYAVAPKHGVCGDICTPLISLWQEIQTNPLSLYEYYKAQWEKLQSDYMTYYRCRDSFNSNHSPYDLLFLSRTCVNGLIRFNSIGEFNNSLHYTRKGINPEKLKQILIDWSNRIKGIDFVCGDYRDSTLSATSNDFIYLDPPYFNTKGRYYGKINYEDFYSYLETLNSKQIKFALSFDGSCANRDYSTTLPKELYKRHITLNSGKSSFRKVIDGVSEDVFESIYLNW